MRRPRPQSLRGRLRPSHHAASASRRASTQWPAKAQCGTVSQGTERRGPRGFAERMGRSTRRVPATPHGTSVQPGAARPRQFAGPAEATQQGRLLRTAVSVTAGPAAIRLRCPALTPSPVRHRAGFRPQALSPPQPQPPPTWQSRERASGTAPSASARRLPAEVSAVERRGGTYSELTWGPGG